MKNKLIEIIRQGEKQVLVHTIRGTTYYTEALADYLIANKVFVFPEKLNDSWELCSGFIMRLFTADEAEIEKIKREFEFKEIERLNAEKNQIFNDIRNYLEKHAKWDMLSDENRIKASFVEQALSELSEYAKKLGVEL